MEYQDKYLPVDLDFTDRVEKKCLERTFGKIHFYNFSEEIDQIEGVITKVTDEKGIFLVIDHQQRIRLDKIITLHGTPGPAYAIYERHANVCLTCEDLDQF
ncbi:MAG: hypothetical protein CMB80_34525 [Flammeovirgaceae bacterium]|nr:hypothetical protein [Flammeovirgaceae bacterium]MBR09170.1 hypothetical protein [Rickettsiales bacterium]HCX21631.1 hypothetical protein [Cytophagales bacterium]|tara:strand:- start:2696 stop:2998 length:303 start_codon:yes stop_codon:yes gene_type:complete